MEYTKTKLTIWAITAKTATCLINVDLPPILGPVSNINGALSPPRDISFAACYVNKA